VAPGAIQVTAFQENNDPDSRPIVDGVTLYVENKRLIHVKIFQNEAAKQNLQFNY
jgi:hypothetical protein